MDASTSSILNAEKRALQYWFSDGLTTLTIGAGCLLFSICMLNPPRLPLRPLPVVVWGLTLAGYMVAFLKQREIVEWFKTKITYPRTGYVEYPYEAGKTATPAEVLVLGMRDGDPARTNRVGQLKSDRQKHNAALVVLALAAPLGIILISNRWTSTVAGVLFGLALWSIRKDHRFSWVVYLGFPVVGLLMSLFLPLQVYGPDRVAYFMGGWGVLFILDGIITLALYVRKNPIEKTPAA